MKCLWRRESASVRQVQGDLLPERKLAYTTVMTVLDRLFRKGAVRRQKKSRAHQYQPVVLEAALRSHAVASLLADYFGGSRVRLKQFLDGTWPSGGPGPQVVPSPPPEASNMPERDYSNEGKADHQSRALIDEALL